MTDAGFRPHGGFLITGLLFILGLIPTTGDGWERSVLRTLHTLTPVYSENNPQPTGYYVGLIDGTTQARDELTLRLVGKPADMANFIDIGAARFLEKDYLQFELKPNVDTEVFGSHFTTNTFGLRDREYTRDKPPGVFRIVLLGSSMDMGWGVPTLDTYENRLEDWLNSHAAKRGLNRRFEVLNFAMAAYSPLHRLETLRRKVPAFQPDLVLYAATRLDTRLLQLHLCNLLNEGVEIPDLFVCSALESVGVNPTPWESDSSSRPRLRDKEHLKQRLESILWKVNDQSVEEISKLCQSVRIPMAYLIVPRAGGSDSKERRKADMARIAGTADRLQIPTLDLSAVFDNRDLMSVEIAPWDDHPNSLGHRLLFLEFGHRLVQNPTLYKTIFEISPESQGIRQDPPGKN